jgi:hypothetical protein
MTVKVYVFFILIRLLYNFDRLVVMVAGVRGSLSTAHGLRAWDLRLKIVRHYTIGIILIYLVLIEINRISVL